MKINKAGWQIINDHIYEEFPIFTVKRSSRINPRTGRRYDYLLMEGLDWANIIPLTSKNEVVLVRQYRHGADDFSLEIPGGCVERGEEPRESALRELKEETGYVSSDTDLLGVFFPNPAMQAMRCHSFVARNVERRFKQALDPGENIEVLLKPLEQIPELILSGEIKHSIVISAFHLFELRNTRLAGN